MQCSFCNNKAVIEIEGKAYCKEHFIEHFENTALDTIKKYKLIEDGDIIGAGNSGGKDSLSLLYFLSKHYGKERVISITIDEGIPGYRDKTIEIMKKYTEMFGVKYYIFSYKELFGKDLYYLVKEHSIKHPCEVCGAFRRYALNYAAKKLGVSKLATAHNLDDEVESAIMNLIQKNMNKLARLGPITGIEENEMFVPRIKPFVFLHEKETMLYALLNGINALHTPCPFTVFGIRHEISAMIKKYEDMYPGFKKNVLSNVYKIKTRINTNKKWNYCKICGFPSSGEICEACSYRIQYGLLSK